MVGGYVQNRPQRVDLKWPETHAGVKVLHKRCGGCHKNKLNLPKTVTDNVHMPPWAVRYGDPRQRFNRHILYNLTTPEKSLLVLAPLAKTAGGYATGKESKHAKPNKPLHHKIIFKDKTDPDYVILLKSIQRAKQQLDTIKRFDMDGFRPPYGYIREMKRYGLLPKSHKPTDPIDPYKLDRIYWKSLWYKPTKQ